MNVSKNIAAKMWHSITRFYFHQYVHNDNYTINAFSCPFLAKPHPCLFILLMSKLGYKYNK